MMPNQLRHLATGRHLAGTSGGGFTLVEMLVSIGIILLMVGISLPIMNTMSNWSKVDAGVNTVGVAAQATRAYFDREKTGNSDPFLVPDENRPAAPFAGIAIVFSPSGEIRLTRFSTGAATNDGPDLGTEPDRIYPYRIGFEDIPNRDYIDIPSSVELYGIRRVGNNANDLEFLRPPFAVRFDGHGTLITGRPFADDDNPPPGGDGVRDEDHSLVFYDANFDDIYEIDDGHRVPASWSVPGGGYETYRQTYTGEWDPDRQAHMFDYEGLETVVGVRVVDPALYDAATPFTADPNSYRDIYFSRYTGSPLRNQ